MCLTFAKNIIVIVISKCKIVEALVRTGRYRVQLCVPWGLEPFGAIYLCKCSRVCRVVCYVPAKWVRLTLVIKKCHSSKRHFFMTLWLYTQQHMFIHFCHYVNHNMLFILICAVRPLGLCAMFWLRSVSIQLARSMIVSICICHSK